MKQTSHNHENENIASVRSVESDGAIWIFAILLLVASVLF